MEHVRKRGGVTVAHATNKHTPVQHKHTIMSEKTNGNHNIVTAVGGKSNTMLNTSLRLIENSQNRAALTFCLTLLWLAQSVRRGPARKERDERLNLPVCLLLFYRLSICVLSLSFAHLPVTSSLSCSPQPSPSHALASLVTSSFSLRLLSGGSGCRRLCGCWNKSDLRLRPPGSRSALYFGAGWLQD